jgi:putative hydrolase of the HAD superfamily
MRPKAILFDLDETLITIGLKPDDAWAQAVAATDGTAAVDAKAAAEAVIAESRHFWADPTRHRDGRLDIPRTRRGIVFRALEPLGLPRAVTDAIAELYAEMAHSATDLFPDAIETVEALRQEGIRLALITNGARDMQRAKVERFGLAARFDHVQIEGEYGLGKPEAEVYWHAMHTLGVEPAVTWMVGDNLEWEVAAPQRLGITGIWHDPIGRGLPEDCAIRPDRIIRRLRELIAA